MPLDGSSSPLTKWSLEIRMSSQANLSFLPWVRQGLAASISNPDAIPAPKTGTVIPVTASVPIMLKVNETALAAEATVHLRGPADVVGIDVHQVVRTEPRPGSSNFESNLFPTIEFDRPDFPWLFTPAKATADSKLRPWLCLAVVRKQAGVTLGSSVGAPLPMLEIDHPAKPSAELPDLVDCWAWAHTQAAALDNSAGEVRKALEGATELSLSRLICPRILSPDTDYVACVVPTFELGRKAGLGLAATTTDLKSLAPAWLSSATKVQLPVYYSWEFRTGVDGNFETLARKLSSGVPDGVGKRSVSIAEPGFAWIPAASTAAAVPVEGALRPIIPNSPTALWSDDNAQPFETKLAPIVNQALTAAATAGDDPLLAPPLYGRWHRRRSSATPGAATWFDELNLDPRWRVAAAVGTRVVQQHQEALMASAWEQAAELRNVNQRLRQLQMSMAVGESLHRRHVTAITKMPAVVQQNNEEMLLRFAAPVFSRIRVPVVQPQTPGATPALGPTFTAKMTSSRLPPPATSPAMRRIGRRRGPITRRVAAAGFTRNATQTWVASINYRMSSAAAPPAPVFTTLTALLTTAEITAAEWNYSFRIAPEGQPLVPLSAVDLLPSDWDYPGHFRSAAVAHLARIRPAPAAPTPPDQPSMATGGEVVAQLDPRKAIAKLAKAAVSTGPGALAPTANGVAPIGIETVMTAPSFPQPMYEPLRELSQDLLLPGLDAVQPNSVLALETNRAFMEAYLVGLNTEMGRELLWRRFPTDQRGTYFRKFWGYDTTQSDSVDIDEITNWGDRPLGSAGPSGSAGDFVLLLRSDLLRRYPNALIYLAPCVNGGPDNASGSHVMPSFNGSMDPDLAFFGFPVPAPAAIGDGRNTGYFVIIQEHPTEPRFGLDPNLRLVTTTHLSVAAKPASIDTGNRVWGSNSAAMAAITLQAPVRIAIRVSRLVAPLVIR
jgi:hypothetical protein